MNPSYDRRLVVVTSPDADMRQICQACLRHAGYDVVTVDDPDHVLDVVLRVRPALIITSYPTCTSSGRPVTEAIRANASVAETPILSLASWVRPDDLARALSAGVTESVTVPVSVSALIGAVHRLIGPSPPVADPRAMTRER